LFKVKIVLAWGHAQFKHGMSKRAAYFQIGHLPTSGIVEDSGVSHPLGACWMVWHFVDLVALLPLVPI